MGRNVFEIGSPPAPRSKYWRTGRMHCFFLDSEGVPKLTLGPHCKKYLGPLVIITTFLIIITAWIFIGYLCPKVGMINEILGIISFTITIIAYLSTSFINSGIVIPSLQIKSKGDFNTSMEKLCMECNVIKEDYTEHCKKCRVCVEEYDDHYILIGKCVGKHTIKSFYSLLMSLLCLLIFIVTTLFFRFKDSL
jgi:DHHC palmitoyltransferase